MLNLVDFILSSIVITLFTSGLFKGAITLTLGNITFLASILLSAILFPSAEQIISEHIESQIIIKIASCSIAYIVSIIVCSLLFGKVKKLIKPICGGLLDKTFGALLGLLNGVLLSLCVFVLATMAFSQKHIYAYDNLHSFIKSCNENQYPNWLKDCESFNIMQQSLAKVIKLPYVDQMLEKIEFGDNKTKSKDQASPDKDQDSLDKSIENLLESGK